MGKTTDLTVIAEEGFHLYIRRHLRSSNYQLLEICSPGYFLNHQNLKLSSHILLAIESNKDLEQVAAALSEKETEYTLHIIRLYHLNYFSGFIDNSGSLAPEAVDTVLPGEGYWVHLETHILDHCNINCKACNNFSPFCRNGEAENATERMEADLRKIKEVYRIGRFFLLGGEPLLKPEQSMDYMSRARSVLEDSEIRLLTNGILIEQMHREFWDCVREHNIVIQISMYPPTEKKIQEIAKVLRNSRIQFVLSEPVKNNTACAEDWCVAPEKKQRIKEKLLTFVKGLWGYRGTSEAVIWGAGHYFKEIWGVRGYSFEANIDVLTETLGIRHVIDSDTEKWGSNYETAGGTIRCESPRYLRGRNIFVIMTVDRAEAAMEVMQQIQDFHIEGLVHINKLLEMIR